MKKILARRQWLILVVTIALALLPLYLMIWYVVEKHQWAEGQLAHLEPRHARLLGLDAQKDEIKAANEAAEQARTQFIYSATQDVNQTANQAQQRVRDIFAAAGLQVISSQALPAKDEKGFDRIPLVLRTEGELLGLQSALAVLGSQLPLIVVNELDVQVIGGVTNVSSKSAPKLSAQFSLSVLRERQ